MAVQAVKNCFHEAHLSITSIPKTIQGKIDECTSTDFKIYGLVVIGAALQAAAVVGIAGIIFAAAATGPFALFGLIPAIAIGVLGVYMTVRPEDVEDFVCPPPYVPDQPVGLANRGNNCWANSGLQLLFNSPTLINSPGVQQVPAMQQLAQAYTDAKQQQNRVVQNVDGQLVRPFLVADGVIAAEQNQEDSTEFLAHLFQNHPLYELDEIRRREGQQEPEHHPVPGSILILGLGETPNPNFNQLLLDVFHDQVEGIEIERKFQNAPDDLFIQLNRFSNQQNAAGQVVSVKNDDPIAIPSTLELAPDYFQNNERTDYTCDGFVIHEGHSINAGHYVTYLKRPDNTWWLCNDKRVRQVTELYAHRMMRQAYICHFSKLPLAPNNP